MSTLALQRTPDLARLSRGSPPPPAAILAQRRSTFGPEGSIAAPPIVDGGRPLDAGTRGIMETGFGHDFVNVRVHDDARAHDNARNLGARAYAAGDHIVFGEGAYRPGTTSGNALIAHELAHSVQQGGVQMKAEGPLPAAADAELEAQADRAAMAVTAGRAAPALTRIGTPAVFRNGVGDPAPAGATAGTVAKIIPNTGAADLPAWVTGYQQDDPADAAPTRITVFKDLFEMPLEKGGGDWVKAQYDKNSNFVATIFPQANFSVLKEGSATDEYRSMWLGKYGFSTTTEVVTAIETAKTTNPAVKAIADQSDVQTFLAAFKSPTRGLSASKSAVDHIIEKHIGGASTPENLQLFDGPRNSLSGSQSAKDVAALARQLAAPGMRGANAQQIQLVFKKVSTKPPGAQDPTYHIETLLRHGDVKGSEAKKAAAEGKPVKLVAGVNSGPTRIKDSGTSVIEDAASRVLSGAILEEYTRTPQQGSAAKVDKIKGTLDNGAIKKLKLGDKNAALVVTATKVDAPAAAAAPAGAVPAVAVPAGAAPTAGAPAGTDVGIIATSEARQLSIAAGPANLAFYYPFLSPGHLTSLEVKPDGLHGEGIIQPTVPMLPTLKIKYGPNTLELLTKLDKTKLKSPVSGFRITSGELKLQLAPTFIPSGSIGFEIGAEGKPVLIGSVEAAYKGGAFVATGKVKLAATVPGLASAEGDVEYHSINGWSGKLIATTSSFANSTANVELGFRTVNGICTPYGVGTLTTKIKPDAPLTLTAMWSGTELSYAGGGTVPEPLPGIASVTLNGTYAKGVLRVSGTATSSQSPKWREFDAGMTITYRKVDGEEGKFSGKVSISKKGILNKKADIDMELGYSDAGKFYGGGTIAYQVAPNFRPSLGINLLESGRVKVKGTAELNDITVFDAWPKPPNNSRTLLKLGTRVQFPVPPMPIITATLAATGELGVRYAVGPGTITGVKITAELYPFESDPKVVASLAGKFSVPASASLYGKFGVLVGAAIGGGIVGAEGGVYLIPEIGVKGEGGIDVNAKYEAEGFSFEALAYAKGSMFGSLGVDFAVNLYAAFGAISHEWTFPLAKYGPKKIGPELDITLGKIAYARDGTVTWPSLSQIDVKPKDFDPIQLVKDIMESSKVNPPPPASASSSMPRREYGPKW